MYPSRHNKMIPPASGTDRKCQKTTRITFVMNGTWFDIRGYRKEANGLDLHLATDADSAELTIRSEGDNEFPALRIVCDPLA